MKGDVDSKPNATEGGGSRKVKFENVFALVCLVLVALAVRAIGLSTNVLWLDELLTVNQAHHGLFDVLIAVLRFSTHFPLYHMQLSLWMMLGTSDAFVMLNSVLWGVLAVVALYFAAKRLAGSRSGFWAGMLLAVIPSAVFYSQQVRPYTFIMVLSLLAFSFILKYFETQKTSDLAGVSLFLIAIAYSHGIGFILMVGLSAYAFSRAMLERRDLVRRLLLAHGIILVVLAPAMLVISARGASHALAPGLRDLIETLRSLLLGTANGTSGIPTGIKLALLGGLIAALLAGRRSRLLFATTVAFPIITVFIISHVIKPIWLSRTISLTVPFICLSLALALEAMWRAKRNQAARLGRAIVILTIIGALSFLSVQQQLNYHKGDDYKPMAAFLAAHARPGDIIVMDGSGVNLWCFLWYYAGPHWGNPLAFHEVNEKWRRLLNRIGPVWAKRLRLVPTQRAVSVNGVTVTASFVDPPLAQPAERIWVIRPLNSVFSPRAGFERVSQRDFSEFTVEMWVGGAIPIL